MAVTTSIYVYLNKNPLWLGLQLLVIFVTDYSLDYLIDYI